MLAACEMALYEIAKKDHHFSNPGLHPDFIDVANILAKSLVGL